MILLFTFSFFSSHIVAFSFSCFVTEYLNYALDNRREWADKGGELVSRLVEKFNGELKKKEAKSKKERVAQTLESVAQTLELGRQKKEVKKEEDVKVVNDLAQTLALGRQFK